MDQLNQRSVVNLPEQLETLAPEQSERFHALFSVTRTQGSLEPPPEMADWIERSFGSVEAVQRQTVVKVLNRWTLEGSLYNSLRARRPMSSRVSETDYAAGAGDDPFCRPLTGTPADTFGRVRGEHSITASNVAKYDGLHSVVIFEHHDPLRFAPEQVADGFETAARWIEEASRSNAHAVYPFVMWNCLPRSGASIVHGHMQVALGEGSAYGRVELWRRAAESYRQRHRGDYFDDLHAAHHSLGIAGEAGSVRWMAHLTAVKEKELLLLAPAMGRELCDAIYGFLRLYVDRLGVRAFNLAVYLPPLRPVEEDWSDFPVVVRLVDRGDPGSATSDIGAMELFAQPVVASDPWKLAASLRS